MARARVDFGPGDGYTGGMFRSVERGPEIMDLEKLLREHGVPLERWGQGEARSLEHLAKELAAGEATLDVADDGRIVRTGFGVAVWVYYVDAEGRRFRLKEDRQVYAHGAERRRGDKIQMSIGEKRKRDESVEEAATRAFEEELGLTIPFTRFEALPSRDRRTPSEAFPGIDTRYVTEVFQVTLNPDEVNPEGYIEVQPDKTTYFTWEPVDEVN